MFVFCGGKLARRRGSPSLKTKQGIDKYYTPAPLKSQCFFEKRYVYDITKAMQSQRFVLRMTAATTADGTHKKQRYQNLIGQKYVCKVVAPLAAKKTGAYAPALPFSVLLCGKIPHVTSPPSILNPRKTLASLLYSYRHIISLTKDSRNRRQFHHLPTQSRLPLPKRFFLQIRGL